jgi:hypothetical protein
MAGRDDDAERLVIDRLGDQTGFEKGSAMTMTSSSPAFSAGIRLPVKSSLRKSGIFGASRLRAGISCGRR